MIFSCRVRYLGKDIVDLHITDTIFIGNAGADITEIRSRRLIGAHEHGIIMLRFAGTGFGAFYV